MAEEAILGYLESKDEISDSGQFAGERRLDHNEVVNVIKSLHGFRYVVAHDIKREMWMLTDEGRAYTATGSPEVQLFLAIPPEDTPKKELQKNDADTDIGVSVGTGESQSRRRCGEQGVPTASPVAKAPEIGDEKKEKTIGRLTIGRPEKGEDDRWKVHDILAVTVSTSLPSPLRPSLRIPLRCSRCRRERKITLSAAWGASQRERERVVG